MHSPIEQIPESANTDVPPRPIIAPRPWSSGLCGCCKDCSSCNLILFLGTTCCLTCWCPFITFGQIAEIVDEGTVSCAIHGAIYCMLSWVTGCECIYSFIYRSKLRQQYMLAEQPCNDCLVHCCCECCALCQEYRELKYHGFKPSLGWEGNLARHNQGVVLPPVGPSEMER